MKKALVIGLFAIASITISSTDDKNPLAGRWEFSRVLKEGPLTILAVFRNDGTYDAFANKKSFVTGTYQVKNDTLFIADPTCNSNYSGTYKLKFFGQRDSVKFDAIQDTCSGRRSGVDGTIYKRVRSAK